MANILLAGYTDWLREEDVNTAFPEETCVRISGDPKKSEIIGAVRNISAGDLSDRAALRAIYGTYEFEEIWFFSESTDIFGGTSFEELKFLSALLEESGSLNSPKIVLLFGSNRQNITTPFEDQLLSDAVESLKACCVREDFDFVFLRIPWIYSFDKTGAVQSLRRRIASASDGHELIFPFPSPQQVSFISSDDLALFLNHLRDRWPGGEDNPGTYRSITIGTPITIRDLGIRLEELIPGCTCRYADSHSAIAIPGEDDFVRKTYGWFIRHDILSDLYELREAANKTAAEEASDKTFLSKMKTGKILRPFRITAELLLGFLIMQGLLSINGVQVQFRLIDFRLLYIMIFGLMYNIPVGLSAAAMASLSLILGYGTQGISGLTLFYEPTNWFVFIVYFTLGAICGYIRSKDRADLAFADEQAKLLRGKYHFLRSLFLETQQEKHEYRQQIISSRDSFGKIFRITQQLDVISPHLIFMHAIAVIEEIMENRNVAIYSVGRNRAYARLEAASRGTDAPRSLLLADYSEVLDSIQEKGIWLNQELKSGMPMYVCGVLRDKEVMLLVMIRKAEFGQLTLYFSNLLKILTGLISTSLLRSLDYQNATHAARYYGDSIMMRPEAFLEAVETAYSMNQSRIASYSLHYLKADAMSPEEISGIIEHRIRENDSAGLVDGQLFLLISQSTPEGVAILRDRFEKLGISMHDADFEKTIAKLRPEEADEQ